MTGNPEPVEMRLLHRLPPHDIDAEESVIAACIVSESEGDVGDIVALLQSVDFFREKNGFVFGAIAELFRRDGCDGINQITVSHALAQRGELEEVGGQTYISDLIRQLPTALGVQFYARLVKDAADSRSLISAASGIMERAYQSPWAETRDQGIEMLLAVGGAGLRSRSRTAHEILVDERLFDAIESHMEDPTLISGLPTGFHQLDLMLDGWQGGTVTLISAETSLGKTAFVQDRLNWLRAAGHKVGVFTTEMGRRSWLRRVVYQQAELDRQGLRGRVLGYTTGERERVRDAMVSLDSDLLRISDIGSPSVAQIKTEARRWRAQGVEIVAIDHIDMVGAKGGGRTAELEAATAEIHSLATDLEIPILMVSHMSRPGASNSGSKMHRLKNSGSKEQDADVVMFLEPVTRDEGGDYYLSPDEARALVARQQWVSVDLDVAKNRDGSVGKIHLLQDWRRGGRFFEQAYS